jgi:hypothetical protein
MPLSAGRHKVLGFRYNDDDDSIIPISPMLAALPLGRRFWTGRQQQTFHSTAMTIMIHSC